MQITATHSHPAFNVLSQRHGSQQGNAGNSGGQASLEAKLQQLKHQLSDCVNCSSASTLAGQKQIQQINAQIQQVQAQLDPSGSTPGAQSAVAGSSSGDAGNSQNSQSAEQSGAPARLNTGNPNQQIDIYV